MTNHTKNVLLYVLKTSLNSAVMAFQELFDRPQDDPELLDDINALNYYLKSAYCQFGNLAEKINKKDQKR